jgi:hypothetical protein
VYKIGQVLFIISSGTKKIEPVQVHSKQTLESWEGTTIQHICLTVDNEKIPLEEHGQKGIIAGVFETIEDAQSYLLKLAANMVSSLAEKARIQSKNFKTPSKEDESDSELEQQGSFMLDAIQSQPSEDIPGKPRTVPKTPKGVQMITLPDGTRARVHMPVEL